MTVSRFQHHWAPRNLSVFYAIEFYAIEFISLVSTQRGKAEKYVAVTLPRDEPNSGDAL